MTQRRSLSLFVEVHGNEDERLLSFGARRKLEARIGTNRDRWLDLLIVDSGEWRLVEGAGDGSIPRLLAKGRLPSAFLDDDDHGSWH